MQNKKVYNPKDIEEKWQKVWDEKKIYSLDLKGAGKPFYNLMMFPYPSAEGLHVGNTYAFVGADIFGRFTRMQGFDVFEPIGLDGFGIHSENYALKVGEHPESLAKKTKERFYKQLKAIGNSFDWTRTLETYDPDYYRWTQWIFVRMFKAGLAYRKKAKVNWCPSCKTVLADEQVIAGKCERCGTEVHEKELEQWFFRQATGVRPDGTAYPDCLLANLDKIDWSEKVKIAQRNWIGRSEGALIKFELVGIPGQADKKHSLEVFTTRPDTLNAATFLVVSPELARDWIEIGWKASESVRNYIKEAISMRGEQKSEGERQKSGVFSEFSAINPLTQEKIPVWVSDYILADYATGGIMGVPAHDERDKEFAEKFGLEIINKVPDKTLRKKIEEKGWGRPHVVYHLRDWLISRQRYWGPPIPMIFCESCAKEAKGERQDMPGWYSAPENDLPVKLPYVENYQPRGTGVSPLALDANFYNVKCPGCGKEARRETDVSDTFLDSAWYFLRYPSLGYKDAAWDPEITKKWLPVNMYIGGAEHAVLHLLYSRFLAMVFKDWGLTDFEEPFTRFYAHGLLIKEGAKISKSRGNIIVPDQYIEKYGADTLRIYLMFLGPYDAGGDFRDTGIEGMQKFLNRVWALYFEYRDLILEEEKDARDILVKMHQTIKKVTENIQNLRYNTAISAIMEFVNLLYEKVSVYPKPEVNNKTIRCAEWNEALRNLVLLLSPFAPHMTEELWFEVLGEKTSIHISNWPKFNPEFVDEPEIILIIQVNGKVRGELRLDRDSGKDENKVEKLARADQKIAKWLEGKSIKKTVFVPQKLINFVI